MLILQHRWISQPQVLAQVRPEFTGAKSTAVLGPDQDSRRWTRVGAPVASVAAGGKGWAFGSGNYFTANDPVPFSNAVGNGPDSTISCTFTVTANDITDAIFSVAATATNAGPIWLVQNNAGSLRIFIKGTYQTLGSVAPGSTYTVTISYSDVVPYPQQVRVNGVLLYTTTGYINTTDKTLFVGPGYPAQTSRAVIHQAFLATGRGANNIAPLFGDNPWQLFAPARRVIYLSTPAAGITGTAAVTNAGDTSAAAGTVTVIGSAAATNAGDTGAATGSSAVVGALARTHAGDEAAAAGSVTVQGSLTRANAADTGAAVGAVTVTGSAAISLMGDLADASGVAGGGLFGAVAAVHRADAAAAAGAVTVLGAVAASNRGDACAAGSTGAIAAARSLRIVAESRGLQISGQVRLLCIPAECRNINIKQS